MKERTTSAAMDGYVSKWHEGAKVSLHHIASASFPFLLQVSNTQTHTHTSQAHYAEEIWFIRPGHLLPLVLWYSSEALLPIVGTSGWGSASWVATTEQQQHTRPENLTQLLHNLTPVKLFSLAYQEWCCLMQIKVWCERCKTYITKTYVFNTFEIPIVKLICTLILYAVKF